MWYDWEKQKKLIEESSNKFVFLKNEGGLVIMILFFFAMAH